MGQTDNAVDISNLAAYAGDYQESLFSDLYNELDAINDLNFWPGVKNTIKMTKLNIRHGAKPYTGNFRPKTGDLQYTGVDLVMQEWQRDLVIKPSDYRQTFMAANRGRGENPNNKNIPFADYVWGQVIKSLAAGINDRTVYFGIGKAAFGAFNPATAYTVGSKVAFTSPVDGEVAYFNVNTATQAGQTPVTNPEKFDDWNLEAIMVGFGAIFAALVTLGKSNGGLDPLVTGAITDQSDAYAIQQELWRSLPIAVQNRGGCILQSYQDMWLLNDSFEDKVSKYTEVDNSTGLIYLAGTNRKCLIKPATFMTGSRRLIAGPMGADCEMIIGTDELSDLNTIATEEHNYTLDAGLSGVL